jgi:hypothetical protein
MVLFNSGLLLPVSTVNIQWATVSDECLSFEYVSMGIEHVNLQDTEAH